MSKPRKDAPLKMPRYRGGDEALRKFINENLRYPPEAIKHRIEGVVEVAYDVDGNGRIKNISILESLGHGCDEEVVRLINLLKYEKAYNKGRNVTSHKKLKVDFKLPKVPVKHLNYEITSSKTSEVKSSKSNVYNYSIKLGG